jgi:hypothetical protein
MRRPTLRLIANAGARAGVATAARGYSTNSRPRTGQVMASSVRAATSCWISVGEGVWAQTAIRSRSLDSATAPPSAPDPIR